MRGPWSPLGAFWEGAGGQLRNPSGLAGRLAGRLMGFANARPNALALAALGLHAHERLIELGCGPGHALRALLSDSRVERVTGLDWSEAMLAQAARRNRRAFDKGRLVLVRGDFAKLPFADGSADAVLAVNVAYFMSAAAAGEAHRVLRSGGRLVIYATHGSAMRRWPFAGSHSHRLFDRRRLAALLTEGGFRKDQIRINDAEAGFGVSGLLAVAAKD